MLFRPLANVFFSFLFLIGLFLAIGPGLHLILLSGVLVPFANLFFLKWPTGERFRLIAIISASSILLMCGLTLLTIGWIKGFGAGQLGYGDKLQLNGSAITWLGYKAIALNCFKISAAAWAAATMTSIAFARNLNRSS